MTGSFLALLGLGALLASAAITCLWAIQVRSRDASHVDVGWATGIAVLAVVYALPAHDERLRTASAARRRCAERRSRP